MTYVFSVLFSALEVLIGGLTDTIDELIAWCVAGNSPCKSGPDVAFCAKILQVAAGFVHNPAGSEFTGGPCKSHWVR